MIIKSLKHRSFYTIRNDVHERLAGNKSKLVCKLGFKYPDKSFLTPEQVDYLNKKRSFNKTATAGAVTQTELF